MRGSTTSDFMTDLTEAAKANPLSAALIGAGIVWLFAGEKVVTVPLAAGRTVTHAAGSALDATTSGIRSGAEAMTSGIRSGTEAVTSGVSSLASSVAGRAADTVQGFDTDDMSRRFTEQRDAATDAATSAYGQLRDNMTTLLRDQPIMLGMLGIAAGAAIAAAFPATSIERDVLGEAAASATTMATEAVDTVMARGGQVVDAVTDEMKKQGLTTDAAKAAGQDVVDRVKRTASAATSDPSTSRLS
jgi:hypothetical protein